MKQAVFLLIKTKIDSRKVASQLKDKCVKWICSIFGPFQLIAYLEGGGEEGLIDFIESLRSNAGIIEIDARRVKIIPGDDKLDMFSFKQPVRAVLLINVNYKEEKERVVAYNLRKIKGVVFARAMWGPTDIVAIVEAKDHESMRNLICDYIKVLKGVRENTTLYCYPKI